MLKNEVIGFHLQLELGKEELEVQLMQAENFW